LLHTPVSQLKDYALTNEGLIYTKVLQNIFSLEVTGDSEGAQLKPDPDLACSIQAHCRRN